MNSKVFSQRFNRELLQLDLHLPEDVTEKTKAVAKVFGITRHLANGIIFGNLMPSENDIDKIAEVFAVCPRWLSGQTDKKKAYSERETVEGV